MNVLVKTGPAGPSESRRWRGAILLFATCVFVYNANLRFTGSYDSLASSLIPFRLLSGKGLEFEKPSGLLPGTAYSIVPSRDGGWVSFYPLVTPLLVTPLYVPVVVWGRAHPFVNPEVAQVAMEKLSASVVAAGSVAVLFLLLRRLTRARIAGLLAVAFAFGTCTWAVSSQALFQHGTSGLLVSLTLVLLMPTERAGPARLALTGLISSLMAVNRPTDVFFWLAAGIVLLTRHRARAWPFYLVSGVVGGLAIAWNLHHFGTLTGGYGTYSSPDGRLFGQDLLGLQGMLGNLFSNRGLVTYSPFMLAVLGWRPRGDGARFPGLGLFLLAYLGSLYVHGTSYDWAGGTTFGARYALQGLPVLFVAMAGPTERLLRGPAGRMLFGLGLAFSIGVQLVGAFCYPGADAGNWRKHGLWTVLGSPPVVAAETGLEDPHFLYPFVRSVATTERLLGADAHGMIELQVLGSGSHWPGERLEIRATVSNLSRRGWSSLGGYFSRGALKLRAEFIDSSGRSSSDGFFWIAASLSPGASTTRRLLLTVPPTTGKYFLQVRAYQVAFGPLPAEECRPGRLEVLVGRIPKG